MAEKNSDVDLLIYLGKEVIRLFQDSKQDRSILAKIEWEEDSDVTVLGEAEVRWGDICGYASRFERPYYSDDKNYQFMLDELYRFSLFQSKTLSDWMVNEAKDYPDFAASLVVSELQLWTAVKVIKKLMEEANSSNPNRPNQP